MISFIDAEATSVKPDFLSERTNEMRSSIWSALFMLRPAVMFLMISACSVAASAEEDRSVQMFGIGLKTCSQWRASKASISEGQVWIYGFWSALNLAIEGHRVGAGVDGLDIVAAVKKACDAHPSTALYQAVASTFEEMAGKQ